MKSFVKQGLLATVLICPLLFSQTYSGTMHGMVADQTGAVIAGAEVTAKNTMTGVTRTTQTDADGEYLLRDLTIGTYDVKVRASGFKDLSKPTQIKNLDSLALNFKLRAGK